MPAYLGVETTFQFGLRKLHEHPPNGEPDAKKPNNDKKL